MKKILFPFLLLFITGTMVAQKSAKKVQPHVKPVIEDYLKTADQAIIGGYIGQQDY
jgi:hypothetical protein